MGIPFIKESGKNYFRFSWLQLLRPLTLSGTISPILAGTLIAAHKGIINAKPAILLLIATLLIQMATNIWNDYFDFKKGQDDLKWDQKPVSRFSPAHHELPYVAVLLTFLAIILGLWLAFESTMWVIPVGIFGIIFGLYYSAGNPSLSSIGLGELVAAIFLGFATTILPFIVQGFTVNVEMIIIAIPFALLISVMILTNNIRDIKKDLGFRKTIAIILGRPRAIKLLITIIALIYIWLLIAVLTHIVPTISLLSFIALPIAIRLIKSFKGDTTDQSCMKWAAYHHWVFGLLFALSLLISLMD